MFEPWLYIEDLRSWLSRPSCKSTKLCYQHCLKCILYEKIWSSYWSRLIVWHGFRTGTCRSRGLHTNSLRVVFWNARCSSAILLFRAWVLKMVHFLLPLQHSIHNGYIQGWVNSHKWIEEVASVTNPKHRYMLLIYIHMYAGSLQSQFTHVDKKNLVSNRRRR